MSIVVCVCLLSGVCESRAYFLRIANVCLLLVPFRWDMLHRPCKEISCGGKNGAGLFAASMDSLLGVINSQLRTAAAKSSVLWLAPTLVVEASLPVEKKVTMTVEGGWNYRQAIEDRTSYLDEVLDGKAWCCCLESVVGCVVQIYLIVNYFFFSFRFFPRFLNNRYGVD